MSVGARHDNMTSASISRRALLQGGALGATSLAVGACTSRATPPQRTTSVGRTPTAADWRALASSIDGDVVRRHDRDFASVSRLFDPRFDRVQPLVVVEATSAYDVREAIAFARRFGLRSRPRAGGHSYVGASTVADGVVIDVGRIATVHYDAAGSVAKIGAGARLYAVHAALARHKRTIPTGTCPTVGAAGLTLGGGIGVASREHGLTSDCLVSLTVVTADGRIRTASEHSSPDLFWACRGGGGGNFGVVTSMRYETQPTRHIGFFLLSFPWSKAPAVIRGWARQVRAMDRSAWANLHLDAGSGSSTAVRVVGTCSAGDEESEASAMEAAVGVAAAGVSTFSRPFLDAVSFLGGGTTSARQAFAAGSDVVPAMTPALSRVLAALVGHRAARGRSVSVILDPLTGKVSDVPVHATAFPWRRSLCDIQWYVGLPGTPTATDVHEAYSWITQAHAAVAPYSAGGYVNYLEPNRAVRTYYGANYPRLRAIKRAVDPTGFFTSPYAIG
jgi:FAD/FMN-containing dehydrogenase